MAMLVHVGVCWLLELKRTWFCRITKFGRLQRIWVRRIATVLIPQLCCVLLLGGSVPLRSGQPGGRTPRLRGDRRIWELLVHLRGARGWGRYVLCGRIYASFTVDWLSCIRLKAAVYRCSLICGQSAAVVCNATLEFPREAQMCIWTEGHVVKMYSCGGGCGSCVVAKFRVLPRAFPRLTGE
jgi:hypothetical protein